MTPEEIAGKLTKAQKHYCAGIFVEFGFLDDGVLADHPAWDEEDRVMNELLDLGVLQVSDNRTLTVSPLGLSVAAAIRGKE